MSLAFIASRRRVLSCCLLLAGALAALIPVVPAVAQQPTSAASTRADSLHDSTRTLGRVVVTEQSVPTPMAATRLGLEWRRTPASTSVIDQRALQASGRSTIVDAVRGLPGITSAYRPGAAGVFSARGFVENGIGVLFDGVRVQSATVTMRTYDAFNFDRVEVMRGPASVTVGEGAAAGAVNFVRRKPQEGPLRVELLAQGNSGGIDGARAGAALTGSLSARSEVVASGSGNWFSTPYEGNRHSYRHGVAGVRVRPDDRTALLIEGDYLDNSVRDAYWGVPLVDNAIDASIRFRNYNRAEDTRYDDRVAWGRVAAERQLSSRVTYAGQLFSYHGIRDWQNFYAFRYVPADSTAPAGVERRFAENLGYDHTFYGTRQQATFDAPIGGRQTRTVLGGEWTRTDFSSPRAYGPRVTVATDGPRTGANAALFPARLDDRRANVGATQLFAENRADLLAGITLVTGINVNRVAVDITRPASNAAFSRTFTPVSGRVGLVGDVGRGTSLYAQYATGAEPVSALLILAPAESTFTLTQTRQVEIGSKHAFWEGRATATTAVYVLTRTNLLTADATNPAASVQVGRQSSRGVELSVAARPVAAWNVEANAAAVRARYDEFREGTDLRDGKRPPNVPARVVNVGSSYDIDQRLTLGAWVSHAGAAAADNSNDVMLPAYTLADAYARVAVRRGVEVTARVKNLFDRTYLDWATRSSGQTNVYFGVPRSLEVTVHARP